MAGTKPGSKFKVTQLGKQCLCGCGNIPKQPGSAFWPGHDMRVKGMLSRLERGNLEEKFRLPDVLVARATMDPEFQVHGYDAETILKLAAVAHSELKPMVWYYSDTQTLVIENGARQAEGEHVAKGVLVFYAEEEGGGLDHDVTAITVENAEVTLKPFVDAILAKYGIRRGQQLNAGEPQYDRS